jgi:hypothetical protein
VKWRSCLLAVSALGLTAACDSPQYRAQEPLRASIGDQVGCSYEDTSERARRDLGPHVIEVDACGSVVRFECTLIYTKGGTARSCRRLLPNALED